MTEEYAREETPEAVEPEAQPGPRVLPILPVSDLVLFPRIVMPLSLHEESAQRLVNEVLRQDKTFGVLASRQDKPEGYGPTTCSRWAPRPSS